MFSPNKIGLAKSDAQESRTRTLGALGAVAVVGLSTLAGVLYYKHRQKKNNEWKRKWVGRHIIAINTMNRSDFEELFFVASSMRKMVSNGDSCNLANNKVLACLFYEPSTRTSCSFQSAMLRLGGKVISLSNVKKTSSVKKGETLSDTIKCLQCYCDAIAIRHSSNDASEQAVLACESKNILNNKDFNKTVILNAGNGTKEHPTQALLDLYTIYESRLKLLNINKNNCNNCSNNNNNVNSSVLDNITVTFVGDLKYGRTVHSLAIALMRFKNVKIYCVAPKSLQLPKHVMTEMAHMNENIDIDYSNDLNNEILNKTDVLYVTRIQKERFDDPILYEQVKNSFIIDKKIMLKCKNSMILMHPLPRVNEISTDIDDDPRAMYFKQMEFGMFMRMALLSLTMGVQ